MANIAALPHAADLLKHTVRGTTRYPYTYGPHAAVTDVGPLGLAETGISLVHEGVRLVSVDADDPTTIEFDLTAMDSTTVPYVNRFIAHAGLKVERYWRTKQYRLVKVAGGGKPATVKYRATPTGEATPAYVEPEVDEVEHVVEPDPEPEPAAVVVRAPKGEHIGDLVIPGLSVPPPVKVTNGGKGYTRLGDIVIPDADYRTLVDAWNLRADGSPAGVVITGPAGTAKTLLVRAFAASLGVPFLKVDGGAIRTADDWAGAFRQDPATKTWAHRWSPFAQVLRAGKPAIILIDEGNRTETPAALNALLGLLDQSGSLLVPDANAVLTLPNGVLIVMTANIGPEFVGTLPIDGAVRQRFPYGIRLDYPVADVESALLTVLTGVSKPIAESLVRMAAMQRVNRDDAQQYPSGSVISTRVLLDIARRISKQGADPREAVVSTLRGQFDRGDDDALSVCIDTQFPLKAVATTGGSTPSGTGDPTIVVGKHHFANDGYGTCRYVLPATGTSCKAVAEAPIHIKP